VDGGLLRSDETPKAPGMKYRITRRKADVINNQKARKKQKFTII
jgi:hypothetical protein